MAWSLARSYRVCETIARREAGNFYPAFCLLPRQERLAMCALYAFFRIADDIGDGPAPNAAKQEQLERWRWGLDEARAGRFHHPTHPALWHTLARRGVPARYLHDVIDGVAMDLSPVAFASFAELRVYCYRVASAVGLACIHVWGFRGERAKAYAEDAGIAFQLTNVLRDLREDASRQRLYLPAEDLARFGYSWEALRRGEQSDAYRRLMAFEVERARGFYQSAWPLVERLSPGGRAVFLVMARTYRTLLEEIERRDYDVFSSRVRVSSWRKALLALRSVPVRLGWL